MREGGEMKKENERKEGIKKEKYEVLIRPMCRGREKEIQTTNTNMKKASRQSSEHMRM